MQNIHRRAIPMDLDALGQLLDRIGGDDDPLWPSPAWMRMRLDGPLEVGAAGGHGPIRYQVVEHERGRRVRFAFDPRLDLDGWHEARVRAPDGGDPVLEHEIDATPRRAMRLLWPLVVRPLHDALIEDLLDNAEHIATGTVQRRRWSPFVRLLHVATERPARELEIPAQASLLRQDPAVVGDGLDAADLLDAFAVDRPPHTTTDPAAWHRALFADPPAWVARLLALRELLVGLVGIDRADPAVFDAAARSDDEVLVAADERHLRFRASVLVEEDRVVVSTWAKATGPRGRAYLAVVRRVHPAVVAAMLRRAAATMAAAAPTAAERELARRRAAA